MKTVILSKLLVLVLRIAPGHHVLIPDLDPTLPFSVRCTQDSLIVHAAAEQPTLEEVEAADPLIAKAGFTTYHQLEGKPNILIAPLGDLGEMCTIMVDMQ